MGTGIAGNAVLIGFAPLFVLTKSRTGNHQSILVTSSMGANLSKEMDGTGTMLTNAFTSLDSSGFTLGANVAVNASAVTYDFLALGADAATDLSVGSYVGDGLATHHITGVGFQPTLVIAAQNTPSFRACWATTESVADNRTEVFGNLVGFATSIGFKTLDADGFTVGTASAVNFTGATHFYVAMKAAPGLFKTISYTGNGADNRSVTGAGFQPGNAWSKNDSSAIPAAWRGKAQSGDSSSRLDDTDLTTDIIQAFESDGFQVGTNTAANNSGDVYYAAFFKDGSSGGGGGGGGSGGGGGGIGHLESPFNHNALDRFRREIIADRRPERIRP